MVLVFLTNTILALLKLMSIHNSYFEKIKIGEAYLYLSYIYLSFVLLRTIKVNKNAPLEDNSARKNCL